MERVSCKVGKALKDAGYPLEIKLIEDAEKAGWQGKAMFTGMATCALLPTYLEVWLWLWREKKIVIDTEYCLGKWGVFELGSNHSREGYIYNDPEECIIASIKYLVENSLIK